MLPLCVRVLNCIVYVSYAGTLAYLKPKPIHIVSSPTDGEGLIPEKLIETIENSPTKPKVKHQNYFFLCLCFCVCCVLTVFVFCLFFLGVSIWIQCEVNTAHKIQNINWETYVRKFACLFDLIACLNIVVILYSNRAKPVRGILFFTKKENNIWNCLQIWLTYFRRRPLLLLKFWKPKSYSK